MYVRWQVMSIVQTHQADETTLNAAGDSVAKYQERKAALCDVGLQAVLEIQ
jgi:hypothetical protein